MRQVTPLNEEKHGDILLQIRKNEIWKFDVPFKIKKKMIEDEEDEYYKPIFIRGDTHLCYLGWKRRYNKKNKNLRSTNG